VGEGGGPPSSKVMDSRREAKCRRAQSTETKKRGKRNREEKGGAGEGDDQEFVMTTHAWRITQIPED